MMYDVIVIGAGPAGATSARLCAEAGLTTLLLDKDRFPRQKPCAGAVSEQALSLLGLSLPEEVIEKECFGVQISFHGRSITVRKKKRIAAIVSRDRFDRFLADQAVASGARFLAGEKAVAVTESPAMVSLKTDKACYETRFLIGADGIHSTVARSVRPPFQKEELALAALCNAGADDAFIDERLKDIIAVDFGLAPLGYGWLFPHRGYFSVGIAGVASEFSGPREALSRYSRSLQINLDAVRGHFIPLGGIKRKIAAGRILLAGDAAGFADPFHGEGIAHAVLAGRLAAGAVIDGIKHGTDAAEIASRYSRECENLIRKQLRVPLAFARLLNRFPNLFIRIFFDNRSVLSRYLDIAAGRTDYRRFLRWLAVRIPFCLASSFFKGLRGPVHVDAPLSSMENKGS